MGHKAPTAGSVGTPDSFISQIPIDEFWLFDGVPFAFVGVEYLAASEPVVQYVLMMILYQYGLVEKGQSIEVFELLLLDSRHADCLLTARLLTRIHPRRDR
jgi:hypothetical protein